MFNFLYKLIENFNKKSYNDIIGGNMAIFSTNIKGKIKEVNIPREKGYISLLEAISNSIHAIKEKGIKNGKISINLYREREFQDEMYSSEEDKLKKIPIQSVEIIDNGIGLDENNFNSFMTCNSDYKAELGGKGVGRFTWLKVFKEVQISSIFINNDKILSFREFSFIPQNELKDENTGECKNSSETGTKILLKNINIDYKNNFPCHIIDIANLIIEHFFIYFITQEMPLIVINDEYEGAINVGEVFSNQDNYQINKDSFKIFNSQFNVYHIKSTYLNNTNRCILCANLRAVQNYDLRKNIANLQSELGTINGKKLWYCTYVCSDYLDEIVSSERLEFRFPKEDASNVAFDLISFDTLIDNIINNVELFLSKDLEEIEKKKKARIDNFINYQKPQYRNLRKYRPEIYKKINPNLTDEKLDQALFAEKQEWEKELKKNANTLFNKAKNMDYTKFEELKNNYIDNLTALGKDCLSEYTSHRKAILDMLKLALEKGNDDKYPLEQVVHNLICPMKYTSDDLKYEDMNLWIIDERLSYHYYLASDKQLTSHEPIETNSISRLDIAIYDAALAFDDSIEGNKMSVITIIEFKRPMRDDYTDNDNPVKQILEYVDEIRNGKVRTSKGRPLNGNYKTIPINAYIISDITPSLLKICKNNDFTISDDQENIYKFHNGYNVFIEIKSFDKIYNDAYKRNQILFQKLFTPEV